VSDDTLQRPDTCLIHSAAAAAAATAVIAEAGTHTHLKLFLQHHRLLHKVSDDGRQRLIRRAVSQTQTPELFGKVKGGCIHIRPAIRGLVAATTRSVRARATSPTTTTTTTTTTTNAATATTAAVAAPTPTP